MKSLTLILPTLLLAASYAEQSSVAQEGCKDDRPYGACRVSGSPREPKLTFNKNGLTMNPKSLCTEPGADVEIKIRPANKSPLGSIVVVAKKPDSNPWLTATNDDPDDPDTIRISIPESVEDGDYDYMVIDRDTGQCLDPRWAVGRG